MLLKWNHSVIGESCEIEAIVSDTCNLEELRPEFVRNKFISRKVLVESARLEFFLIRNILKYLLKATEMLDGSLVGWIL